MRKVINRKTAFGISILVFALLALLSIWPFRVWTNVMDYSAGGELVQTSDYVNYENVLNQKFVIQYKRLHSIDIYVDDIALGRYINVAIFDENSSELFKTYIDIQNADLPGFVSVPIELNVEVGKEYSLVLQSCRSKYSVGLEDVPDTSGYVGSLFYAGGELPGRHINAVYHYTIPISKTFSVMLMMGIALLSAILYSAVSIYYGRFPERNEVQSWEKMIRYIANPLAVAVYAALMIMVFPLRMFDQRAIDIIFYELGLLICAFITFYAINHKSVRQELGVSFWQSLPEANRIVYALIMVSMSMVLWYGCNYMNDLYDIFHTLSERKMIIWFLIMALLTFSYGEAVNIYNVIWLIASTIGGVVFYNMHLVPNTEKEYDLHNAALKYAVIIAVLLGFFVINIIRQLLNKNVTLKPSVFGIILSVFFVMIILFRNTRWWGAVLAGLFLLLYYRVSVFYGKKDWYKILYGGLMLNFIFSLVFSLLHRYFPGYVSGRFGFIFHTVTVTAEYLVIMGATAAVALLIKVVEFPMGGGVVNLFKSAWKEMILFGWTMAYAIFTVSRTAYVSIIVCLLAVMILTMIKHRGQFLRIACTMVMAVIICFPAAFTLQRIVPTMVADPVFYAIDDADSFVRGGAMWDSPNFMCVERFAGLFSSKILGKELGDYSYPVDKYNYDDGGNILLDDYGYPIEDMSGEGTDQGYIDDGAKALLAADGFTRAEYHMLLNQMPDYVDAANKLDVISNGRITIFRSYIRNLNLTGHDVMGAELPGGEIAVHAHNTYIQVAYDHGIIVGGLFILLTLCALFVGAHKYLDKKNGEPLVLLIFALTIGFVVAGMTEWVFHLCNPMTIALFLSFAGIIAREVKE